MIITIDPGAKASGLAYWTESGQLFALFYLENGQEVFIPATVVRLKVLVETQQIYMGAKSNPNSLISVAFAAGELVERIRSEAGKLVGVKVEQVLPRVWTKPYGKMKKAERLKLTEEKLLNEREKQCLAEQKLPKSKRKELIDALGIGLWYFGRLTPPAVGRLESGTGSQKP